MSSTEKETNKAIWCLQLMNFHQTQESLGLALRLQTDFVIFQMLPMDPSNPHISFSVAPFHKLVNRVLQSLLSSSLYLTHSHLRKQIMSNKQYKNLCRFFPLSLLWKRGGESSRPEQMVIDSAKTRTSNPPGCHREFASSSYQDLFLSCWQWWDSCL